MDYEKRSYSTSEVARLYNISADTLYYYEKEGLLVPRRNPRNNYREYTPWDMHALNTIREMLSINFSVQEIREHFHNRNVAHTAALFNDELAAVNERIFELMKIRGELESRLMTLTRALTKSQNEEIEAVSVPTRSCILISDEPVGYWDIDDAIIHYSASHDVDINVTRMVDCYTVDITRINEFNCFDSKNVFLYSESGNYRSNYELPAGTYITCTYRGFVWKSPYILPKMLEYAQSNSYEVVGDPLEFCIVDEYDSDNEDEFVTRLELPVVKRKTGSRLTQTDKMLAAARKALAEIEDRPPAKRLR